MAGYPQLTYYLNYIEENARTVVDLCSKAGIEVFGVTKVTCGYPPIAWAMIRAGVKGIADSRLANLLNIKKAGVDHPLMLLRPPSPMEAKLTVEIADISINSSLETLKLLNRHACLFGRRHRVMLAIECGDLREGVLPEKVLDLARQIKELKGLEPIGLATNFACLSGVLPTTENTSILLEVGKEIERELSLPLSIYSGGATVSLSLLEKKEMPKGINQLRIGEAIICGTDTSGWRAIPYLKQDTTLLRAVVLEVETKAFSPTSQLGHDAFGHTPTSQITTPHRRAVLSLGRIDVEPEGLTPLEGEIKIVGASSDHLILDVTQREVPTVVGETIAFHLSYQALLRASISPYVEKKFSPLDYFKEGL